MPEGAVSSRSPAPVEEGRWQASVRACWGCGHGSEVMSGSPVISSSVPQVAACPRVPRSGGIISYGRREPMTCNAATQAVLPAMHTGGFCAQILPGSGMLLPASPKQFLPCHLQRAPWGSCHKCTHGTLEAVRGGIRDPWVILRARGWSEL